MRSKRLFVGVLGVILAFATFFNSSLTGYATDTWLIDQAISDLLDLGDDILDAADTIINDTDTSNNNKPSNPAPAQQPSNPAPDNSQSQQQDNNSNQESQTPAATTCNHSYASIITKEPTCVTAGVRKYTCTKCGASYEEAVPATGVHNYVSEVTKKATCASKGETTYTCSVCGDSYTEEIAVTGHSYVEEVTIEPTCTEPGLRTHTCSVCGDAYTEEISALGHRESEYTQTKAPGLFFKGQEQVVCTVCGEVLTTRDIPSKIPVAVLGLPILLIVLGALEALRRRVERKEDNDEEFSDFKEIV